MAEVLVRYVLTVGRHDLAICRLVYLATWQWDKFPAVTFFLINHLCYPHRTIRPFDLEVLPGSYVALQVIILCFYHIADSPTLFLYQGSLFQPRFC